MNACTLSMFCPPDQNIKKFMNFYRSKFPQATVLPKMHILEEHVVPWVREWGVGFGLMGEQGAESIHSYFNNLVRTYKSIPNPVDRLRYIMKEHLLHTSPENIMAAPVFKKRKIEWIKVSSSDSYSLSDSQLSGDIGFGFPEVVDDWYRSSSSMSLCSVATSTTRSDCSDQILRSGEYNYYNTKYVYMYIQTYIFNCT